GIDDRRIPQPGRVHSQVESPRLETSQQGGRIPFRPKRDGRSDKGAASTEKLVIPLAFQSAFSPILLIIELIQAVFDFVLFRLPSLFGGALRMIDLIVVIIPLAFQRILSGFPFIIKSAVSSVSRSSVVLLGAVGRRLLRPWRPWMRWFRRRQS